MTETFVGVTCAANFPFACSLNVHGSFSPRLYVPNSWPAFLAIFDTADADNSGLVERLTQGWGMKVTASSLCETCFPTAGSGVTNGIYQL